MARLDVRPEAELDAFDAATWYESERNGLGLEFTHELRAIFGRIENGPWQFPLVFRNVRRAMLHRFPFGVFFTIDDDALTVLAIVHLHRHASAWRSRLGR